MTDTPKNFNREFDFLVFIGRFQPPHNGHMAVIKEGLQRAERLIVLCGSAHQPRSTRNPWTVQEREQMIRQALPPEDAARLAMLPLMDVMYNDSLWIRNVQESVKGHITAHFPQPHREVRVGLIGHSKDNSSYYLSLFPQWKSLSIGNVDGLSATPMRTQFLSPSLDNASNGLDYLEHDAQNILPDSTRDFLREFAKTETYKELAAEQAFINDYQQAWVNAPYPVTFVTTDALVVQSGHILLVERKLRPGKGLWALPGGFVNQDEILIDAAIRELREETRLKVPSPVLKGSLVAQEVFDEPNRSARGRTITHCFYFSLRAEPNLPKVKGSDDAKYAFWLPLGDLDPNRMFEDHYFIIQKMLGAM